jgi:AcrR family transcriptional regulator
VIPARPSKPTPQPTLRERRREKRTLEILTAALEVFSEQGYSQASMDAIAERALLTRVGLYKHFRDKATLVIALREWKLAELAERVQTTIDNAPNLETKIRAIVFETIGFQNDHKNFFRVLVATSFSADIPTDESLKPYLYTLQNVLEAGIQSGELKSGHSLEYAGMLATLAFEPSIKRSFVSVPEDFVASPELAEMIVNLFLHGAMA